MKKEDFVLPEGVIYLDGNSLGPLPKHAARRVAEATEAEWGQMLVRGWNAAGWMDAPTQLGDRIAPLIGAGPGTTMVGDTLSIKVFQALSAALDLRPERKVILTDSGNFPTDVYMAEGLVKALGKGHTLRIVEPEDVLDTLDDDVAVLMLTHVDYRTGRMHDMATLSAKAREVGAITLWDLAHSAGALPVDLAGVGADFAVGCTYKYLNGGPGAPAFIYIRPDMAARISPILSGWLGHAAPFNFDLAYSPAEAVGRMRVGTPPVLQMAALDAALDLWDDVSMDDIRDRSIALSGLFIAEVEARCPTLSLASPRDPELRGSQVSFRFDEGYAAMQALISRGVIGDFRAPDIMRFGFTPLYLDEGDIRRAVDILEEVMAHALWDEPKFKARAAVT
ncbi:MAG: kynureninase [Pseudomonadota bacterium]